MRSKRQEEYDAIIVGSGAAGGMSAYVLACSGLKVLMLEAGRDYDPVTETPMFQLPRDAPMRGAATADKPFGFYNTTVDGGWEVPGEPYSSAEGTNFRWWRARMLGGRTNHWGRISLRMGEYDFAPYSRDGLGFDWPMSYEDVAPYYDKTEALIGVYGSNEGLESTRLPGGHPEGFIEAFANVYRNVARTLRDDAERPFDRDFPTVEDGAHGVNFIHKAVESNERGAWVDAVYLPPLAGETT